MSEGANEAVRVFARDRRLVSVAAEEVRPLTPMLITGSRGSIESVSEGELAPGLRGRLIEQISSIGGGRHESAIVLTEVPESVAFVAALVCRDREVLGDGNPAQLPAERWTETRLESEPFNRRYVLLTLAGQDAGWVYELFSPAMLVWLTERAPPGLSFEINERHLAVGVPGPLPDAAGVEALCAAAAELAARIRTEAEEEDLAPDLFDESAEVAAIERALPKVTFDEPPPSAADAVTAYRNVAARTPAVLISAFFWAVLIGAVAGGLVALVSSVWLAGVVCVLVFVAAFPIARVMAASRHHWGTASVSRVGLEAFVREYARSRELELRDRWRFHAEHRHLPLPGLADHVLEGEIPGLGREGLFVMLGDAAEMRSEGVEMRWTTDRPLASSAIVVRLPDPPSADALATAELPEEWSASVAAGDLIVWRPILGNLIRTAAGSDRFREHAGEVIARLERAQH